MDSKDDKKPKRLVIIGNGADLHVHLKSRFSDFIASKYSELDDGFESIKSLRGKLPELMDKIHLDYESCTDFTMDWKPIFGEINNFWVYWLKLRQGTEPSTWSDIETKIQMVFNDLEIPDDVFYSPQKFADVYNSNKKLIPKYRSLKQDALIIGILALGSRENGTRSFRRILKDDLSAIESKFCSYLAEQVDANDSYLSVEKSLLLGLSGNESFNLLNFNYTQPSGSLSPGPIAIKNVHGSLDQQNIIFGIDTVENPAENSDITLTKTYRTMLMASDTSKPVRGLLAKSIDTIVFFGHSLSRHDYSYFQSIFDSYNLYGSDIRLIFYYSIYEDQSDKEMPEEFFQNDMALKVSNLINEYGKTLDNEDHGKNLLEKLILEERIVIRDIAEDEKK